MKKIYNSVIYNNIGRDDGVYKIVGYTYSENNSTVFLQIHTKRIKKKKLFTYRNTTTV